ncbi:hypothetical protein [Acidovorax sp. Leaf84]|uniref:hypothetical protein n=1 Tax=Acidovorax sp. Leaf84 TaxID=1736240 RepID=UPI0012E0F0C2|nr:hypothetical protein [Acidovorax sp. Leaf84]
MQTPTVPGNFSLAEVPWLRTARCRRIMSTMRSSMAMAGVVLGLSMGGLSDAAAAMMVSGVISADTVWSAAQSPVTVQGDVTVDQDATLTVEPGVEVRMAANASFTLNRGAVVAVGTVEKPIVISSAIAAPAPGSWGQWRFRQGTRSAQTRLEHVRIEYGSGVVIEKSSPTLDRVSINHHRGPAIEMDLESSPSGQSLSAAGNTLNAIVVPSGIVRGQVLWGLVGIPYLVREGLVEIGQPSLTIEPELLNVGAGTLTPMRVVLDAAAPAGGRLIALSSSSSDAVKVPATVTVAEGSSSAAFEVRALGFTSALLSASHPELGSARAQVNVVSLPALQLDPSVWSMALGMPYGITVRLPAAAPAGGIPIQLRAEPSGIFQLPAGITVPAGQSQVQFVVQGLAHGSARISAQAQGLRAASVDVETSRMTLILLPHELRASVPIVVGDAREASVALSHRAPLGGLTVRIASEAPNVVGVSPAELVVAEGDYASVGKAMLQAKAKGQARVQLSAANSQDGYANVTVRSPTVLRWGFVDSQSAVVLGHQLRSVGGLWIERTVDGEPDYGAENLSVELRCVSSAVCEVPSTLTIPSGRASVEVTAIGVGLGVSEIEAKAAGVQATKIGVHVVEPTFKFADRYGTPWSGHRYMGLRQDLSLCFSVPAAHDHVRFVTDKPWSIDFDLSDQNPAGVVSGIYAQSSGGSSAAQSTISPGMGCSSPLFVGEASQMGRYRVNASSAGIRLAQSAVQRIHADRELSLGAACSDCIQFSVVKGFHADIAVRTLHLGDYEDAPETLTLKLRCVDAPICSVPAEITIPSGTSPWTPVRLPVLGLQEGTTTIEASVPGSQRYPEVYSVAVSVAPPVWTFSSDDDTLTVPVGQSSYSQVCIGKWDGRSYATAPVSVSVASSKPEVLRPSVRTLSLAEGDSCVGVDLLGIATGKARVSFEAPGLTPAVIAVEVLP